MAAERFATAEELLAYITDLLHLQDRTITFHMIEDEFGSGSISCAEDLENSDAFDRIADSMYDQPFVMVDDVYTYQLGEHESNNANYTDLAVLENTYADSPRAFDAMIRDYAEMLFHLRNLNVANPAYDEDELDNE